MSLPLSVGASGEEVRDLHRRLAAAGHRLTLDLAHYGAATATAIEQFQVAHGLDPTGVCDAGHLEHVGRSQLQAG